MEHPQLSIQIKVSKNLWLEVMFDVEINGTLIERITAEKLYSWIKEDISKLYNSHSPTITPESPYDSPYDEPR